MLLVSSLNPYPVSVKQLQGADVKCCLQILTCEKPCMNWRKMCLMENWYGELASKLSKELKLIDKRMQATVHAKGIGVTEHQCKFQFNKSPIPFMCGCYRILLQFIISLCTSMYELLWATIYWLTATKQMTRNKEPRRWNHLYLRVYMATYDACITHSLSLYRSRNKLNQTNESNSIDQTDSHFQLALDQNLSLDPCMQLGASYLIHAVRRRGFLKTRALCISPRPPTSSFPWRTAATRTPARSGC
jgi:hypothetical protein